jgi:hypothetical protein
MARAAGANVEIRSRPIAMLVVEVAIAPRRVMSTKERLIPGPDHPITVAPTGKHVVVKEGGGGSPRPTAR